MRQPQCYRSLRTYFVTLSIAGRRVSGGSGRREQVPAVVPAEAGEARHGSEQGGAAHLHTGAAVLPRQAGRQLLPRGHTVAVSTHAASYRVSLQLNNGV